MDRIKLPSLTIFFPFLNDEKTVFPLLSQAYEVGEKWSEELEVIALHGGASRDGTFEEILRAKEQFPDLIVLDRRDNQEGYAVIRHGWAHGSKEWVFYTDGDGQYSLADLPSLIQKALQSGSSVVNGFKSGRGDSWIRTVCGKGYQWFCRRLFRLPIRDVDCDFRLMRRNLVQSIALQATGASILTELILKLKQAGAQFAEVPVSHFPRLYGRSNYSVWGLFWEKLRGDLRLWACSSPSSEDRMHQSMHRIEREFWWYQGLWSAVVDALHELKGKPFVCFDLGCGTGGLLERLSQSYSEGRFSGIDLSSEATALGRGRGLTIEQGSLSKTPWPDRSADVVLLCDVLCMLASPREHQQALAEALRLLKPGGLLIVHEPAFSALRSPHDDACGMKSRFTQKELAQLIAQVGFTLEWTSYRVCFLFPLLALVKVVKKWTTRRNPRSDLRIPWFNGVFKSLQLSENRLLKKKKRLPFGTSVWVIGRVRDS